MKFSFLPFFLLFFLSAAAQKLPIGGWKEYLPYGNAIAVTSSDNKVYCATPLGLYSVNRSDGSFERYSKITGLSDIGYNTIAFDKTRQLLFIAYANSNIDLMTASGIINIPDIKLKNIIGDKNIYDIFFDGDNAYLSCGFGIVVINLTKNEIRDTYIIGPNGDDIRVNQFSADKSNFYAATVAGLFMINRNNPNPAYFANWTNISGTAGLPAGEANKLLVTDEKIYCTVKDTLFERSGSSWSKIFYQEGWTINAIKKGKDGIILCENTVGITDAKITLISGTGNIDSVRHSYFIRNPLGVHQDNNGALWIADFYSGLIYCKDSLNIYSLIPNGPGTSKVNDIAIYNHNVFVATGGVSDWQYTYNRDGLFIRRDDVWYTINQYADARLDTVLDIFTVTVNPNTGNAFFGSYGGGLLECNQYGVVNIFKQNSSMQPPQGDPNSYRVSGVAFDKDGNMWLSNFTAPKPISLKTTDGKWYSFRPNVEYADGMLAQVVVDNNNYKWFVLARSNGILVYDSGNKIDDPSDDRYKKLGMGIGKGGLPNLAVNCLAVDKDGQIWVGTDQGIAVYYCPSEIFSSGCDAQQILVKEDQYYNYLLVNEVIHDIEIDGANRKWISTDNGIFLMSADGTQQIYHFTESNSPLFSNFTTALAIDNQTGEVFIGTEKGIQVFRSEAMDEQITDCQPFVYPNPVRENYDGPIAIKGLISNADVKITDIAGNLVYQTKALGTQVIWNGKMLNGERAATGVYLVLVSGPDGTKTCKTKLVLIN